MHQLHEIVPPDAELWCRPEALVQHGDPAEQILATANQCGADLIVLGVRGLDALTGIATHCEPRYRLRRGRARTLSRAHGPRLGVAPCVVGISRKGSPRETRVFGGER